MNVQIKKISLGVTSKKRRPNGTPFAAVNIIRTNKGDVVRSNSQLITDLQDSLLLSKNINDIDHPAVIEACRDLIGGQVDFGNVTFHKAGDKYILDETSSVITDKNHPDFGKFQVGDEYEYTSDGARVNGFLTLTVPNSVDIANKTASKLAMLMSQFVPQSASAQREAVTKGEQIDDNIEVE